MMTPKIFCSVGAFCLGVIAVSVLKHHEPVNWLWLMTSAVSLMAGFLTKKS